MIDKIQKLDEAKRLVCPSYVIITKSYHPGLKAFQCLICRGNPSWSPADVEHRYCIHCDIFHDDIEQYLRLKTTPPQPL